MDILSQVVDILKELWIYCNQIENQSCGYTAQSCGYTVNIIKKGYMIVHDILIFYDSLESLTVHDDPPSMIVHDSQL